MRFDENFYFAEKDLWKLPKFLIFKSHCQNYGNSPSHIFDKNFVKATFLLKNRFDGKKGERISRKISSNQLFSKFFSKTIAFTKFLRKKCEREFLQFPHCEW